MPVAAPRLSAIEHDAGAAYTPSPGAKSSVPSWRHVRDFLASGQSVGCPKPPIGQSVHSWAWRPDLGPGSRCPVPRVQRAPIPRRPVLSHSVRPCSTFVLSCPSLSAPHLFLPDSPLTPSPVFFSDTQWSGPMATSSSRTLVWRMKGKQARPHPTQSQSSGPRISLPPKFSSAKHTTGWSTTGH